MISRKRKCLGFTFVEMLLATAMVSVVAIALYGMISSGLKVWQIVNQESDQVDSNLLFERMSRELKNSICFKNIDFVGQQDSISFACIAQTPKSYNGFNLGVGQVKYFYDQSLQTFNRQYIDYEESSSMAGPQARSLISNISNILISYYFYDEQKETFLWSNVWPPESYAKANKRALPLSVRVAMVFATEETISKKIKTIDIPIGAIEY